MSGIEFDPDEFGEDKISRRVLFLNILTEQVKKDIAQERGQIISWKKEMCADLLIRAHYKPYCDEFKQSCMYDVSKRINRYKVIALMQEVILKQQPLVYVSSQYATDKSNRNHLLNVYFALECGFHLLTQMNEKHVPQNKFSTGYGKFNRESFIDAIRSSLASQHLWNEHKIFLAAELHGDFPVIPISHFWYALDQWGLTHAEAALLMTGK